jgi:hypothetical protein
MIVFPDPGKKGGDKGHRFLGLIINTVLSSTDLPSQIIDHVLYIKELGYSFSYTVGSKKARWLGCGEKCPTNVWLKLDKYLSSTAPTDHLSYLIYDDIIRHGMTVLRSLLLTLLWRKIY